MANVKRSGGLTGDINLNRGRDDNLLSQGAVAERAHADKDERILEQAQTIKNLQNHILHLEKQIERIIKLNPTVSEEISAQAPPMVAGEVSEQANSMAQLLQQSTLLRSYEALMGQFDGELARKSNLVEQLERDYQQATAENNMVIGQLLKLKQQGVPLQEGIGAPAAMEQEQVVDLLKRNHDVMMEKYELYRQRNETLEKTTLEKEQLYLKIKSENDSLSDQCYTLKRVAEDLRQENSLLAAKLQNSQETAKTSSDQAQAFKVARDRFEVQLKTMQEQLSLIQRSYDELASQKLQESELLTRDLNKVSLQERETRSRLLQAEKELGEARDHLRSTQQELDVRSRENDHIVNLLEDQESKISIYEEKEKQVYALATESRKRIEDANLERDRVLLKEQQYLASISRLEEELRKDSKGHGERHDRIVESLRSKHRVQMEQKAQEFDELSRKLSDQTETGERARLDRDALREENAKLQEQWRSFKSDTSQQYESFNKQLSKQESLADEKIRQLQAQCEKLTDQEEARMAQDQQSQLKFHEQEVKLDGYMRDYERLFDENKRLRDMSNTLRDDKETAIGEVSRLKVAGHSKLNSLQDECNLKVAHLESSLIDAKERHTSYEEKAYAVITSQEKVTQRWKDEHRKSVQYFERLVSQVEVENRILQDQVVEAKSKLRALQRSSGGESAPRTASKDVRASSKSREKSK